MSSLKSFLEDSLPLACFVGVVLLQAPLCFSSEKKGTPQSQYPLALQAQLIQNQLASNNVHELKNRKRTRQEIEAEIADLKAEQGHSVFKNPRLLPDLFRRERKLRAELKRLNSGAKE